MIRNFVMCVGVSASGKSTFIKSYIDFLKRGGHAYSVICPDELRKKFGTSINDQSVNGKVWSYAKEQVVQDLRDCDGYTKKDGTEFNDFYCILDAMNIKAKERKQFLKYIREQLPNVYILTTAIVFPANAELSKQRITKDIENGIDRANVPFDVIDRMVETYHNGISSIEEEFDVVLKVQENESLPG